MRKWYKRRGGYLPRIPWGQRPKWYRPIVPFRVRVNPPKPEFHLPPEIPWQWEPREKAKKGIIERDSKKFKPKRVITVPLSSDQKKLLEINKPKLDKRKKVKPYKDTKSYKKKRLPGKQQESQSNKTETTTGDMPRRKRRMTKRMFRANRPVTRLKRWLRPPRGKKKLTKKVIRRGTGSTFSSFYSKKRYKKNKYKYVISTFPWQKILEVKSDKITSDFNEQGVRGGLVCLDRFFISDRMEPELPASDRTGAILIDKVECTAQFSNMSKASVIVDIIEYHYRKDSGISITALWDNGLGQVATGINKSSLGATVFMSPHLTQAVKIDRIHTVELGQGQSHMHKVKRKYNRIFNLEDMESGSDNFMSDWTFGTMFVQRGEPINGKDTQTTVVNTSATAVDYVVHTTTTYKYALPLRKALKYYNTITQLDTAQMLDEGSGEVEDVVSA